MPESNLSGLGSAPDEPFSSSSSGSPEILGTNQLQVAIDKFDQAVNKLADLYSKARTSADASGLPGVGGGISASANAGGPVFPQTSATPGSGIYSSAQAQPGQAASKTPGLNMWSSGGNGQGFINQFSFGGGSPGVTVPGGGGGSGGGGGGFPGTGSAGWSSFTNAFASGGTSQLGTQVAFSNYLQSAYRLNAGAPGTGTNNRMLAQAVGRPGAWNTGAQSPADALAGTALMQQQAGSAALTGPGSSQYGRSMYGAAAATSYLTGSDWSQSSQLSSWLYQPMTSYRMMMMGFPQPTQPGGQGQTLGLQSVLFGINQRNFGRGTIDPKTASQFFSTRGVGYQELLQLTGGNTDMANQLASTDIGINQAVSVSKKRTGKQLDWNQVYGMLQGANTGNKGDRSTLDKLGITETEQRRLQDVSATKTGTQAELFNSFQSGMTAATAAANSFANVLQKILSLPGVNQLAGMSAGMTSISGPLSGATHMLMNPGSAVSSITSGLSSLIPGLSGGGTLPGYRPGVDSLTIKASPGEGILVPEAVRGIGGSDAIDRLNKKYGGYRGAGYPGVGKQGKYAGGGTIPTWPFPTRSASQYRRVDEGWDLQYGGTKPVNVLAVASGTIGSAGPDPNGFGISYPLLHLDKPIDGFDTIYYGHTFSGPKGHVSAGGVVGHTGGAHSGGNARNDPNWLEIGFWPPSWANGKKMRDWLLSGKATGGNGGPVSPSPSGSNGTGGSSSSGTSGSNDISGMGMGGGSPSSTSEADNVAAGLAGGSSGIPGGQSGTSGGNNAPAGPGSRKGGKNKGGNVPLTGGGTPSKNRALGQKIAADKFGWTGPQWSALDKLWGTYESGWRNDAQNPGSTAYGIAQFLDTTWKPYGKKTSNPGLQELYGMEYIRDRYKDPIHALAFELSHTPHWYSGGTDSAKAGAAVLGERGPEIALLSGGQKIFDAKQTQEMLQASKRPAQAPWKVASGGTGAAGGGNPVTLQFAPGSIVIGSGDASGSRWATANSAWEFVRKVKKILEEEELNCAIAAGQKAS